MESRAWNWDSVAPGTWTNISDEFLPIAQRWKSQDLGRILDLGCGIGRNALYMARLGLKVYAFDLSESGLRKLREEAVRQELNIDIQQGDMLSLPYANGFFDGVLAFHSIYHTDLQGLRTVMAEIHRVLRPGGEAFITLNSKDNYAWRTMEDRKIDGNTLMKVEAGDVEIPHTFLNYDEVIDLLSEFSVTRVIQIFEYAPTKIHAHFVARMTRTE